MDPLELDKHFTLGKTKPDFAGFPLTREFSYISLHSCTTCLTNKYITPPGKCMILILLILPLLNNLILTYKEKEKRGIEALGLLIPP